MNRNISLATAGLLAASLGSVYAQSNSANNTNRRTKPLNIIHIMTDDHSYQTISAYGHPISKLAPTPNLDRLAEKGMLFTRAYVENSLSAPSRACLMTGLYSHQNGQRTLTGGLDTTKTFFPELLQQAGYQTAIIGKWHLGCDPKGFDYYRVLRGQGEYYAPEFKTKESNGKYIREEGYATDVITDHAIEYLESRDKSKPFCLLVHHKAPHRSWQPNIKYLGEYENIKFPLPETFYDDYSTRGSAVRTQKMSVANDMTMVQDLKVTDPTNKKPAITSRMTPEEREKWLAFYNEANQPILNNELSGDAFIEWKFQRYIKDYVRCIKSVDESVGRLLDYLEENDLMDNTVVVYTSDQGFYMGEHGWFDKRFMYEESFRTPLIIYYPGLTEAGSVCEDLVQNIDYAPTYLAVAGIQKPEYMVGTPLQPVLDGDTPDDWREYLYYHYYEYPGAHWVRPHDGVSDKRYKLIHFYGKGLESDPDVDYMELYDLEADPNETHNVYGDPAYKEIAERLQAQLDKFRKDNNVDEY